MIGILGAFGISLVRNSMSNKYKESLEDMLGQFAYHVTKDGKPCFTTGGLSALEFAFDVMGWDDPHYVDESNTCDVEGCFEWYSAQLHWDGMYCLICSEHAHQIFKNEPRPQLKQRALDREAKRDPITGMMPMEKE